MADINGGIIRYTLRGDDQNLTALLSKAQSEAATLARSLGVVTLEIGKTSAAVKRQEAAFLRTAQAQARLAAASGNHASAARILQSALAQVGNQTVASVNAQTQLVKTQAAATKGANTFANSIKGISKELGVFGAIFVGQQLGRFVGDLVNGANELEKTKAKVEALSKSQAEYEATLKLAGDQQKIFGGSLTKNLESLGAFLNLSQRTGVKLKDLENVARRLAIVDPIQGFEGAAVALKEFFSGDITSLSRRFEIPRSVLNGLKEIEDPIARFQALDAVIADLGFTQEVLISQTKTTANVYDQAAGQLENAKNAVGSYIAEILKVPTQVVTEAIFKSAAENIPQATPEAVEVKKVEQQADFLTLAANVTQYNVAVQFANKTMDQAGLATSLLIGHYDKLSEAQFNAAKAAVENGRSAQEVANTLNTLGPAIETVITNLNFMAQTGQASVEWTDELKAKFLELAFSSEQGSQQAGLLAAAWQSNRISADELAVAINNLLISNDTAAAAMTRQENASALLTQRQGEQSAGVKQLSDAELERSQNLIDAISKEEQQASQEEILIELKAELARLAPLVANGTLSEGQAAEIAAGKFNLEASAIRNVIAAKADLLFISRDQKATDVTGGRGIVSNAPARRNPGTVDDALFMAKVLENEKKANDALAESEKNLAIAQGGRAAEIGILKGELSKLQTGTVDYNNTLARLSELQAAEAKSGGGGGGGGAAKLSAQDKLNNQLASNQDKFQDNLEKAEVSHQQKLLDIQEEFAAKQLEAQRESEVSKRGSRADFYESLIEQDGVDQQKYSAQYEEAFAESQKLAQEGQLKLSQELLALRQKQIQQDIEFDKKREAVKSDEKLSGKDKEARLKAIDNVQKLRDDAQAAEEKALREGGDSNLNALNESLSAEEERYNEQTGKVSLAASQAADARIANWRRANQAINADPAAELLAFGNVPTAQVPANTIAANTAAQVNANIEPIAQSTPASAAVIPPDQIMSTRIVELALVRDEGVISEIQSLAARLEARIGELNGSVLGQTGTLGGKLDSIASAVRNIKSARLVNP